MEYYAQLFFLAIKLFVVPYGLIRASMWSAPLLIFCTVFTPRFELAAFGNLNVNGFLNLFTVLVISIVLVLQYPRWRYVPYFLFLYMIFVVAAAANTATLDAFYLKTLFLYVHIFSVALYLCLYERLQGIELDYVFVSLFMYTILGLLLLVVVGTETWVHWGGRSRLSVGIGASVLAIFLLSMFLYFLSSVVCSGRHKAMLFITTGLIMATQTRVAIAIMAIAFLAALFLSHEMRGRWIRSSIIIIASLAIFVFAQVWLFENVLLGSGYSDISSIQSSGRIGVWLLTIERMQDMAFWGYGTGSSARWYEASTIHLAHPHNEYLRLIFENGLFGMLFILIPLFAGLAVWGRSKRSFHRDPILLTSLLMAGSLYCLMITDDIGLFTFALLPVFLVWIRAFSIRGQDTEIHGIF